MGGRGGAKRKGLNKALVTLEMVTYTEKKVMSSWIWYGGQECWTDQELDKLQLEGGDWTQEEGEGRMVFDGDHKRLRRRTVKD